MSYRLSFRADADLVAIYRYSFDHFGADAADAYFGKLAAAFDLLAEFPEIGRERSEIDPPVRIHPVGHHIVVYLADEEGVLIVRVRHQREDW